MRDFIFTYGPMILVTLIPVIALFYGIWRVDNHKPTDENGKDKT